jgi:hypothetical protein
MAKEFTKEENDAFAKKLQADMDAWDKSQAIKRREWQIKEANKPEAVNTANTIAPFTGKDLTDYTGLTLEELREEASKYSPAARLALEHNLRNPKRNDIDGDRLVRVKAGVDKDGNVQYGNLQGTMGSLYVGDKVTNALTLNKARSNKGTALHELNHFGSRLSSDDDYHEETELETRKKAYDYDGVIGNTFIVDDDMEYAFKGKFPNSPLLQNDTMDQYTEMKEFSKGVDKRALKSLKDKGIDHEGDKAKSIAKAEAQEAEWAEEDRQWDLEDEAIGEVWEADEARDAEISADKAADVDGSKAKLAQVTKDRILGVPNYGKKKKKKKPRLKGSMTIGP